MKIVQLPSSHYASKWAGDPFRPVEEITQVGIEYADMAHSVAKEEKLLELVRAFHPYLMKYIQLIRNGHLSLWGNKLNADTKSLCQILMPKDKVNDRTAVLKMARSLHLAFKGIETDELYNILAMALIKVIRGYDPRYSDKVQLTVQTIDRLYQPEESFTVEKLNEEHDHDSTRIVRMLCGRNLLAPVSEEKGRFHRVPGEWPPPARLFQSGPVGIVYYVQKWFRYSFEEIVTDRRKEVENMHTVQVMSVSEFGNGLVGMGSNTETEMFLNAEGALTSPIDGKSYSADLSLVRKSPDASSMTLDWVQETKDPIFAELSIEDRYLLYLVFTQESTWEEIAHTFNVGMTTIRNRYSTLIGRLRELVSMGVKK